MNGVNNNNRIFVGQAFGIPTVRPNLVQGRLGVVLQRPTPVLFDQFNIPVTQGLVIAEVLPESAAAKAGILKHDILLAVNGSPVPSDIAAFQKEVFDMKPGAEIGATVIRRGQKESIKGIKLADARPEMQPLPLIFQQRAVPNINILPRGGIPIIPQIIEGPGAGLQLQVNGVEAMSVSVVNDAFTIDYAAGEMKATVKGVRANGKMTPNEITIRDGEANASAKTVDELPERYRATVNRMLDRVK